ncbi:MAG: DNA-directed RNA polymerase subunit beta [Candidatus Aminicenantia bacterium]
MYEYKEEINKYRERKNFSKIKTTLSMPNFVDIQKKSFHRFLQMELMPEEREDVGLQAAFKDIFPISDFKEVATLDFISYSIGNWECKCGKLKGVENYRPRCNNCGTLLPREDELTENEICPYCGEKEKITIPICDYCGDNVELKIKYSPAECKEKGYTYSVPLRIKVRLICWDRDAITGNKRLKHIKESEVYFGEIPLMTENGTFIINGTERVVVSQLQRSPGVFFRPEAAKGFYIAKIIPYRGAWVEFDYDNKNILYVRLDRKKRFLAITFLRALGFSSDEELIRVFYTIYRVIPKKNSFYWEVNEHLIGKRVSQKIVNPRTKQVILPPKKKITKEVYQRIIEAQIKEVPLERKELEGGYSVGEIRGIIKANEEILDSHLRLFAERGEPFDIFFPEKDEIGNIISQTIRKDPRKDTNQALMEIYRKLRPGEPHTLESAYTLFHNTFFNPQRYNFSRIGRLKMNIKLGLNTSLDDKVLSPSDYISVVKYLLKLRKGEGEEDDIDHLGNRRVRSVGELVENAFRIGLTRMERAIKEKMTVAPELTTAMPQDLINSKPVIAALKEFFGSSQLSQFMDQINELAEITHKRRLSALGPGGLSRERAGFEVRDIHSTHYGRICPIETPEGPNIGLISSLSTYARVNEFGFIESPYRKVEKGRVVDYAEIKYPGASKFKRGDIVKQEKIDKEIERLKKSNSKNLPIYKPYVFYLIAWEEEKYNIAQANARLDEKGNLLDEVVDARQGGNFKLIPRDQVDFIDVSPKQLVSLSTSLIPFLENDDANRALMGSNMQRQAVPLLKPEAPLVGTGMEYPIAKGAGGVIICRRSGVVEFVDAERIIVRVSEKEGRKPYGMGTDLYVLTKFQRSNQNTIINQRPIVKKGDRVEKGQIIADSACTDKGELSLGRNVLVVFIPWRGYNFEDAIIVSEKLVKEDIYTSIHIVEESIDARDTKLGPEEITRDIPNVPENMLRNLDENGIVRIGAKVKPGDILVGKVSPKGETQLSPEEKLLKAIFGEKALDVKDASLYCPPGVEGTVVDVRIFSRRGLEKDARAKQIEKQETERMRRNLEDEISILNLERLVRIKKILKGEKLERDYIKQDLVIKKGEKLTASLLEKLEEKDISKLKLEENPERNNQIRDINIKVKRQIEALKSIFKEKVDHLKKGDELAPGIIKSVKVLIAMKRKLSVGDKTAGRHGNKGVIAKIVPEEDMPFLPDGTPIEIVLNPLGVPSRMNVGQILETHLGWVAKALNLWVATPVFDGAKESEIKELLAHAGLPTSGKTVLYDGLTGEPFDQEVTVGYIYMMKLYHLVDDKIHARSTGPYSLITQQPLGGKAQFGGQRFGEMEVWALEAYGAAYSLQEILTAKSDDVEGRAKIYEAIVKGDLDFTPGLPESVNVLIRELQSLALNVELLKSEEEPISPWGISVSGDKKGGSNE